MGERAKKQDAIEERSDAWERFTRAVDAAVRSGPRHRAALPSSRKKGTNKSKRVAERGSSRA